MYKPILFNTEMVRAILHGNKTVTRRKIKHGTKTVLSSPARLFLPDIPDNVFIEKLCLAPYQVGDILYVRETCQEKPKEIGGGYFYKTETEYPMIYSWIPSIHMPKEAARIYLRVIGVRVEHLQDITEEQAVLEGCEHSYHTFTFSKLWDSTVKKADLDTYGWNANPWVWVIEFEKCDKPLDFVGGKL